MLALTPLRTDSLAARLERGVGVAFGAATQVVNEAVERVVPTQRESDMFVLQGEHTSAGAELVRRRFDPPVRPVDFTARRAARPLLARAGMTVRDPESVARVVFRAAAPGADFAARGRESTLVSVYVDGRYHSDVTVLAERPGRYAVNLGTLPLGPHVVELRAATDISPRAAAPARVDAVTFHEVRGAQALVDRHAPVLETRHTSERRGPVPAAAANDLPLLMVPSVRRNPDGTRLITYGMLFSAEDGGTRLKRVFRRFGRSADYEPVYRVLVDRRGRKIRDSFQGPGHLPYRFRGQYIGGRPVLRVATRNNLFAPRALGATPRWSEAPVAPHARQPSDREVMLRHPWTWAVMGKELLREGRISPSGVREGDRVPDTRRFLYFDARDGARQLLEQRDSVELVLRGGRRVTVAAPSRNVMPTVPNRPAIGTAIPLPPGIDPNQVVGITGAPGRVIALDRHFRPRLLAAGDAAVAPLLLGSPAAG